MGDLDGDGYGEGEYVCPYGCVRAKMGKEGQTDMLWHIVNKHSDQESEEFPTDLNSNNLQEQKFCQRYSGQVKRNNNLFFFKLSYLEK